MRFLISRAICAGLIEAMFVGETKMLIMQFPAQFARASLKQCGTPRARGALATISRAICAGLIEAAAGSAAGWLRASISRAICAGLIEASHL